MLDQGSKVGIWLGDIMGAFDRVRTERLVNSLKSTGMSDRLTKFFADYLKPRLAQVVVEGKLSRTFEIANQVFQGTVLGPPFWNVFFADVSDPIRECAMLESAYADDIKAFKAYLSHLSNQFIVDDLKVCSDSVRTWGSADKQIIFDPTKDAFVVLHRVDPFGVPFKLLGVTFDTKLLMETFCFNLAQRCH